MRERIQAVILGHSMVFYSHYLDSAIAITTYTYDRAITTADNLAQVFGLQAVILETSVGLQILPLAPVANSKNS